MGKKVAKTLTQKSEKRTGTTLKIGKYIQHCAKEERIDKMHPALIRTGGSQDRAVTTGEGGDQKEKPQPGSGSASPRTPQ